MLNAMGLEYIEVALPESNALYYPETNIDTKSIPNGLNMYYVSKLETVYRISENISKSDYGIILAKKDFHVCESLSRLIAENEWKVLRERVNIVEYLEIIMDKDYYIQKAEEHYLECMKQEKHRLRLQGLRNAETTSVMELYEETARVEEWVGLYLKKYGNDGYKYWKENRYFTLSEVTRILKYFYTVKEPEYYIEKYAEESMKCLDNVAVDLPEESKKIAAYKLFRQNADEDERAGYYLALYGPMAYRKWTEAVGLYSPETERISRILKEICIEKQHCA